MSLLDIIQQDIADITSNANEFGRSCLFTAPDESTATVVVLHSKHRISVDGDGVPVNSKNSHISVSEQLLTALDYPVRDDNGEVNLSGHTVAIKDSTGTTMNYLISEWFPDETIGLIVCILQDYGE